VLRGTTLPTPPRPLVTEFARTLKAGRIAETAAMLRCEECGKLGEASMKGWRPLLGVDIDDEDAPERAYSFCPDCAEREFGPPRADRRDPLPSHPRAPAPVACRS
jgi:hypothetical protein